MDADSVTIICPYCKKSFLKNIDYKVQERLFAVLIKTHPYGEDCHAFIAFIDANGDHRGSQKIDTIEENENLKNSLLQSAKNNISELEKEIRFYHLKRPRKLGNSFEHKVANVKDRAIMSTDYYIDLIQFLKENSEDNLFGLTKLEKDIDFEGGFLVFGKYLGMIFTLFWNDQKDLQNKPLNEIEAYSNLTVEKLIDLYNITDIFI